MSKKIGIFSMQEQAIEAIQALEGKGFQSDNLKVIAKDHEHVQRIESETDIHADELNDLVDTRAQNDDNNLRFGVWGFAGVGALGSPGYSGGNPGAPAAGAGLFALTDWHNNGDGTLTSALHSLGLNHREADVCRDAIREGSLVVVAETGSDGADVSLAAAEETFRSCGAEQVL
jgi:hypothetical protein